MSPTVSAEFVSTEALLDELDKLLLEDETTPTMDATYQKRMTDIQMRIDTGAEVDVQAELSALTRSKNVSKYGLDLIAKTKFSSTKWKILNIKTV